MRFRCAVLPVIVCLLACGGAGSPTPDADATASSAAAPAAAAPAAAAPEFGSVAFQTYESDGHYMKFRNDTKVDRTWDNMVGEGLKGTYTQVGNTITVVFEPGPSSTVSELRFRQLDDCSIANYYRATTEGKVSEDESDIYRRSEPRCPHR